MGTNILNILSVNAGSSSIKLALFTADLGNQNAERTHETSIQDISDLTQAASAVKQWLDEVIPGQAIDAIGHRIVHGGPKHDKAELITNELMEELRSFTSFDPEHLPAEIELIYELGQQFPDTAHVACFDTAFFHDLPIQARLLPLPRKYEASGLRRYGFHGLSYSFLLSQFRNIAGEAAVNGRVIYAHLGSGASLAATHEAKPIDTTMSFTPASGIIMSSRSGDIDPGLVLYMQKRHGLDAEQFNHMVNFESGLLGVSELSASMLTLLQNESSNQKAAEAVELFVYQVRKSIGSLSAALGGLDSLVFSGGIGEQSSVLRGRICEGLGFLGIEIDQANNDQHSTLISTPGSRVGVHVIPTDEASIIIQQVCATLSTNMPGGNE